MSVKLYRVVSSLNLEGFALRALYTENKIDATWPVYPKQTQHFVMHTFQAKVNKNVTSYLEYVTLLYVILVILGIRNVENSARIRGKCLRAWFRLL